MCAAVLLVKIPRLTVADIIMKNERLILCENAYCVDTRVYAVGKREIDDPVFAAVRNGRLCHIVSESV